MGYFSIGLQSVGMCNEGGIMNWQKACFKSKKGKAITRTNSGRVMIRNWDGSGIIERHGYPKSGSPFREASDWDLEGYTDWEPLQ